MLIKGLQKLTLLDYPEKCAATVFTFGCNLRCPFCHNASLVLNRKGDDYKIEEADFFKFLDSRKGLLDGVTVTGGEPLLQPDIENFIAKIKERGFLVKLDTNGTNPKKLKELLDKQLVDYVAMDIKNCYDKYPLTVGVRDFDVAPIKESVALLLLGKVDYEFRTTVCAELFTEEDFYKIATEISGAEKYFLQAFIDSGDLLGGTFSTPSKEDLNAYAKIVSATVKNVGIRGI